MPRKIRLGMVGGGRGSFIGGVHRIAARMDGHFELVAGAFSSDADRAAASAVDIGVPAERAYPNFSEMAAAESEREDGVEAVAIVTPNHMHAAPALAFAGRGVDVICDKPLADTLDAAQEMAAVARASGIVFALTHNYTGHPMVRQAREMVVSGEIGAVRSVKAVYMQDWLSTPLEREGVKQAEWRTDPARAGIAGALGDIGSHAFHLARFVTGLETEEAAADVTVFVPGRKLDDDASVLLRFSNGAKGALWCSQISPGHENDLRIAVYGEKGGLRWSQESPNALLFSRLGKPSVTLTRGGAEVCGTATRATRIPAGHPEGYLEAFAQIYADAAELIRARQESRPPARDAELVPGLEDGLAVMRFIDAAVRSGKNNSAWTRL